MKEKIEYFLNALMVIVLVGVLYTAFSTQFINDMEPCPLCLLQRVGMIGAGIGALCNLRFGIRPMHYGLSLLSCLFGAFVSLRQIALHVCPGFPTFGYPFLGLSLYTWALLVFGSTIFAISLLLIIFPGEKPRLKKLTPFAHIAFLLLFLDAGINVFNVLYACGLGACR